MMRQPQDLRLGEYLHLPLPVRRQFGVQARAEAPPFGRHPQNGSQQYANIPCTFGRQALLLELPVKIRYPLLRQRIQRRSAQLRLDILPHHIPIPAGGRFLQLSPSLREKQVHGFRQRHVIAGRDLAGQLPQTLPPFFPTGAVGGGVDVAVLRPSLRRPTSDIAALPAAISALIDVLPSACHFVLLLTRFLTANTLFIIHHRGKARRIYLPFRSPATVFALTPMPYLTSRPANAIVLP